MLNEELISGSKQRIKAVNLHLHSRYSDGAFKPKALLQTAVQNGLDLISITDHDTVEAYGHLPNGELPLRLLPGIEFSSIWDNNDIHILGYGLDVKNPELLKILIWMKNGRRVRAEKMLDNLARMGIKVPLENVLKYAGDMQLIIRPHIAQAMVEGKYVNTKQEAFEKYIGNEGPAYVPKPILTPEEVIKYIHDAGGMAIVAHPGKLPSLKYLDDFLKQGIDGLEVWHPEHSDDLKFHLAEFCEQNKLLQTGGSDYHGEEGYGCDFYSIPATDAILNSVQMLWEHYIWTKK